MTENATVATASVGGVFTNFDDVKSSGQFFIVSHFNILYEKPGTPLLDGMSLSWCSDVAIANITQHMTALLMIKDTRRGVF